MKKCFLYIAMCSWAFYGIVKTTVSQKLVSNWSFEEHDDTCNDFAYMYFENVKDWLPKRYLQGWLAAVSTFSTPDYFSSCVINLSNKPPNIYGFYQYPYHQESFVGIVYHGVNTIYHDREAVRIELKEALEKDICYHAEMYVNFANISTYICDKLGMALTIDSFAMLNNGIIPMPTPQVYTNLLINDTLNWTKIEGNFTAQGGEKWLTIGWFFPTVQINYFLIGDTTTLGIVTSAYYLIDAVQVYPCTDVEEAVLLPNAFSPNGDGINDFYVIDSLPPNSKVSFFNRWGSELYRSDNYQDEWDGTYMGNLLPTGTYFVVVQMPYGTKKATFVQLAY